jgi:hypothetical protein
MALPHCTPLETLCDFCEKIDLEAIFDPQAPDTKFDLGSYEAICSRASSCSFCNVIVEYVNNYHRQDIENIPRLKQRYLGEGHRWTSYLSRCGYHSEYLDYMQGQYKEGKIQVPAGPERIARLDLQGARFEICQLFDNGLPSQTQRLRERLVTTTKLDVSLLKHWLQTCCTIHGNHCEKPSWLSPAEPENLRLIDIRMNSVIQAHPSHRYAALSYVWGGPQYTITETQMRILPFELPKAPVLSQTIADAMSLCQSIGIDYLWVDALCITQDPPINDDKAFQLQQMDRIYRSAVLTICAASSESAKHGISELRARPHFQNIVSFKGKRYVVLEGTVERDVDSNPWNWRGWTYQERVLSRRLLILTRKQTYWVCQSDIWAESTVCEPSDPSIMHQFRSQDTPPKPPQRGYSFGQTVLIEGATSFENQDLLFATYEALMQEYTRRTLGTPRDGLNAIQGIFNLIAETGPCRGVKFIHGLPTARFDLALLWKPFTRARKMHSDRKDRVVPTWSWASWFSTSGPATYYDMSDFFCYSSIRGAVTWYVLGKDGVSKLLAAKDVESTKGVCGLPWTGESPPVPPPLPGSIIPRDEFYLHFYTSTARFSIGARLEWDSLRPAVDNLPVNMRPFVQDWTGNHTYEVLDRTGVCIGHVILVDSDISAFRFGTWEFVFLSYANDFDQMVHEDSLATLNGLRDAKGKHDIVSCMMVGRDQETGFVERCAVGKVLQSAWEAEVVGAEWVVLG